jgi:hypothetical protein
MSLLYNFHYFCVYLKISIIFLKTVILIHIRNEHSSYMSSINKRGRDVEKFWKVDLTEIAEGMDS